MRRSGGSDGARRDADDARWRRLARWAGVDIYAGEERAALLLFAGLFLSYAFQYTVKSVRQSTFIDALGAERLPWVYLLVALCSYPLLRLYGRLADRLSTIATIWTTCGLIVASLVAFWWLLALDSPWVPLAFYVWMTILFVLISSQLWFLAGRLLDARQAKRLFGLIGAGGLLGSVAGGQAARLATVLGGSRDSLLVAAVLMVAVVAVVAPLRQLTNAAESDAPERWRVGADASPTSGFAALGRSRQLLLISALMALGVLVGQIVDLQFNWAVQSVTGTLDERTVFFGNVFSVMGLCAFAFQLVFASRIHRLRGLGFSARVLPATMAVGSAGLLATAAIGPAGAIVAAALVLKVSENGLRYSLDQATRELFFMPVPAELRRKAKVFIDVFIQRASKGVAALLLLPVTFGLIAPLDASWIALAVAAVWLVVAGAAAREYVRSFRRRLGQRRIDTDLPINLSDPATLEILVQSLGSSDPRLVLHSLEVLAAHDRHALVPPVLLYHDDAEVRLATLKILDEAGRDDAAHLVERRLNDPSPDVRAEAIRVLARLRSEDACDLMLPQLERADPRIRAAAIACLLRHGESDTRRPAADALHAMLLDESPEVRIEAAKALGELPEPEFQAELLQLLYDREPAVVCEGIATIRRRLTAESPNPIYLPTLISLLENRRVKHEARETLVSLREASLPALLHYLNDPDEHIWVRRAIPKAVAAIGSEAAVEGLLECLAAQRDAFLRRKLIEALALVRLGSGDRALVEREVEIESRRYLETMLDLASLRSSARSTSEPRQVESSGKESEKSLLEQLLEAELEDHLRNIFGLLALTHDTKLIWSAYDSLTSGRSDATVHTLEYLDNTLPDRVRQHVFAAIGDAPPSLKRAEAERLYGIGPRGKIETIRGYLESAVEPGSDTGFFVAAALHQVFRDRLSALYGEVSKLTDSGDVFVSETARWVAERVGQAA